MRTSGTILACATCALLWTAACTEAHSVDEGGPDADADTDADTDVDADADTDADTDVPTDDDTDTEYTGPTIPPTCADAALAMNSVGCDFYPVDMDNYGDDPEYEVDAMTYAVVVSNPHADQSVVVTLDDGDGETLYEGTLPPLVLDVINVACASGCLTTPHEVDVQGIGAKAAFHLTSDYPILAYQWNPYGVGIESTDASLLLPVTSLGGKYIGAAWDNGPSTPGTFTSNLTIVATEDDTQVTITPSVDIPSLNGVGPFTAGVAGAPITLDRADVLVLSPAEFNADLTGTAIEATATVAVYGGHACALVPDGVPACDHVEEQLLPLEAWGTSTVMARFAPREGCVANPDDSLIWRVIAGAANMTVTFDPPAPAPAGASFTFTAQGQVLEFESGEDHVATAVFDDPEDPEHPEAPFFAYQMMTGCLYGMCTGTMGDPMMLQSPPAGNFLDRYVFNTDDLFDFDYDHIIVVREAGTTVTLDCLGELSDDLFTPVGASDWEVARVFIDNPEDDTGCVDGPHLIEASEPIGVSVVGTSYANSYGYLGGVGVKPINPAPVIE